MTGSAGRLRITRCGMTRARDLCEWHDPIQLAADADLEGAIQFAATGPSANALPLSAHLSPSFDGLDAAYSLQQWPARTSITAVETE